MLSQAKLVAEWTKVNSVTNNLADVIANINQRMTGRGINPAEVPIVQAKLLEVETILRQIGSNPDKLVPIDAKVEIPLGI